MTVTNFIGLMVLGCLVLAVLFSLDRTKPFREGLSGLGALLTAAAALAAVYWYLEQRPDAARISFVMDAKVLPVEGNKALVITEISIENKGSSVINFRKDDNLKVFLQQITPLHNSVASSLAIRDNNNLPTTEPGELWVKLSSRKTELNEVIIESQETEHFYFRTLLDCQPELRFYVQAKMNARYYGQRAFGLLGGDDKIGKVWVRQTFVDASEICKSGEK